MLRRLWPRLLVVLGILGSAHYYIWWRFVGAPDLPAPWHTLATVALICLAPCLPLAAIVMRNVSRTAAAPLLWLAYTWFGTAVYLLLGALLTQLLPVDARTAAAIAIAAVAVTVIYGLWNAKRGPIVRRVRIVLPNLGVERYTIAHLTDVHIGPTLGEAFAQRVADRTNAVGADLIVLTGDLVDGRVAELAPHVAPLAGLRARDGVYAVTGNHEYYWNADAWIAHFTGLGMTFLRNERRAIGGAFELAGVDDSTSGTEDIPRAVAGRGALPVVLLAHHPSQVGRAVAAGVDLQISGHTHGGQLLPLGWLSRLFEPHVAGLARFGATQLYVSEGTGFWGPPMRIGTHCEIAAIELVRR